MLLHAHFDLQIAFIFQRFCIHCSKIQKEHELIMCNLSLHACKGKKMCRIEDETQCQKVMHYQTIEGNDNASITNISVLTA